MVSPTRFRRIGTALSFFGAGILILLGMALTPWEEQADLTSYYEAMLAAPTQFQVAPLFLHFGYALLVPAVFGSLSLLRGKGATLGHIAVLLGVLGLSTLPGLLVTDWMQLAIAQTVPIETALEIEERAQAFPLLAILMAPAVVGFLLAPILVALALWRAGHVGLHAPIAIALGWGVAGMLLPPTFAWMTTAAVVALAGYTAIAMRLLNLTDAEWEAGRPPARGAAVGAARDAADAGA